MKNFMFLVTISLDWQKVCSLIEQEHMQETKKTCLVQLNYEGEHTDPTRT
jgi:hypothetical protein